MTTASVNDKDGKAIAKVKVGDTKLAAINRLGQTHDGVLFEEKDGVGLTDTDVITAADAAPYELAPLPQQQQNGT